MLYALFIRYLFSKYSEKIGYDHGTIKPVGLSPGMKKLHVIDKVILPPAK